MTGANANKTMPWCPDSGLLHQDFLINTTPPIINAMPSNR